MRFYIVDVFALKKYTGNQLAVFRDASKLSEKEMQEIAKEMNYSETTFIISEDDFEVRIFTPEKEVPFAGHPVLGTAFVIMEEILGKAKEVELKLRIGKIRVWKENDVLWMRQSSPKFGKVFSPQEISRVLEIGEEEIDKNFPIQEVSTGLPFIIVPLKSLESLKKVRVNTDELYKIVEDCEAKAILAFSPETRYEDNDLSVRVFAHYYGVPEDPATGSANGCLAAYLSKYEYFGSDEVNIKVEQGYEVGRPSLLFLRAKGDRVEIGGKVIMIAKGTFI
ncbi:phenazine biosynthesis protein PhzF family [Ferroglobus placidus DSM 10642]|uniref:Phenazine biosynthesis protein PhzF family n=1 Tax=Ferroglobus placidus (strain DSM 10642 / AEDII12DO) TaxID=589924 RepID=D3RWV5_FERPA|nr:PhzF family phenazine biosynthesis protein [Ferroglobus placidus]ADC64968.1 phenazine biosynthesis protein PhzF family [Ferroglobus placidus DSM 10642]